MRLPLPTAALPAIALGLTLLSGGAAAADDPAARLQADYARLRPALAESPLGLPAVLESSDEGGQVTGEVFGTMDVAFMRFGGHLAIPATWCEVAPLHLNVKACTYAPQNGACRLTFYAGRKFYEPPGDAYQLAYRVQEREVRPDYLRLLLTAAEGPLGTADYRILLEAVPVAEGRTFIRFRYGYRLGTMARLATRGYLATLGADKVGFTVTGRDAAGNPEYLQGLRGIAERNVVRYYFAVQTYLETLDLPPDRRFGERLERWFALTERFPEQLHELERADYLEAKRRERENQRALQTRIGETAACERPPATSPAGPAARGDG